MKEYSSDYQELLECAISINQDTIAITDYNSVEVFPKIERFITKNKLAIKVIYGAKVSMLVNQVIIPVTILVRNQTGLKNLYKIISQIKTENLVHYDKQIITKEEMEQFSNGLLYGLNIFDMIDIYQNLSDEDIQKDMLWYDFIGINASVCNGVENKEEYAKHMISLAKTSCIIVVATGNIRYNPESEERYLKTTDEMLQDFSFLKNNLAQEIVLDNTRKLASLIDSVEIIKNKVYFPQIKNSKNILLKQTYEKAYRLYGTQLSQVVEQRIHEELYGKGMNSNGILTTKSEPIYLIYKDLVETSHHLGYLVLPRGYTASYFIAYLIGITNINPLPSHYHCLNCSYSEFNDDNDIPFSSKYACGIDMPNKKCPHCHTLMQQDGFNLSPEMFLGNQIENHPPINLNFSLNIQNTLQNYLEERFGPQNVIRAGTIKNSQNHQRITGQHPGGLFLVPQDFDIYDFTPIAYPCNDPNYTHKITHLDYHDLEYHLMKFNILGHPVLEEIKKLEERTQRKAYSIPLNDKDTFHFLGTGQTDNIFEFSKPLAKNLLKKTKPRTFNTLINILGLIHNEKNNQNLRPSSEILFREDLYQYFIQKKMPQNLAYSLTKFISNGGAKEKLNTWKQYQKTMKEYKIDPNFIKRCSTINYLVSKAHCTSYSIAAFQLAWYKVHFPKIFEETIK